MPTLKNGEDMPKPSLLPTIINCFLRTYLIGAAFNNRGMQNIGLAFAIQPWLNFLYPDPIMSRAAAKRYLRHYQCHMLFTPAFVGLCMSMEVLIAKGKLPANVLEEVKSTASYSFSALGDSLYCSGIAILWSLVTCSLVIMHLYMAAIIWTAVCFIMLQLFKVITYGMALKAGIKFTQTLKRWNLINAVSWFKIINSALVPLLAALSLTNFDNSPGWEVYIVAMSVLTLTAWIIWRTQFARGLLITLVILLFWLKILI